MMAGQIALALLFAAGFTLQGLDAVAQEQKQEQSREQTQKQQRKQQTVQETEPVFGRDLMTDEELAEHRTKMRSLQTEEERNAYRAEHHQKMVERAKERGVTLPDQTRAVGKGRGQGPGGQGQGAQGRGGQGQGKGRGKGQGKGPRRGNPPQQPQGPGGGPGR